MYSVLRITEQPGGQDAHGALDALASRINALRPAAASIRRKGDGFAVDISSSADWDDHLRSLTSFISIFADQVVDATQLGTSITLDVAIEPGDEGEGPYKSVRFNAELLVLMSTAGVDLEVTRYP